MQLTPSTCSMRPCPLGPAAAPAASASASRSAASAPCAVLAAAPAPALRTPPAPLDTRPPQAASKQCNPKQCKRRRAHSSQPFRPCTTRRRHKHFTPMDAALHTRSLAHLRLIHAQQLVQQAAELRDHTPHRHLHHHQTTPHTPHALRHVFWCLNLRVGSLPTRNYV